MPTVEVEGSRIAVAVFGQGTPIVFIPPPVVGSSVFFHQAAGLSAEFQVILPELRGHGKSRRSDRPYTFQVLADDLVAVLNHLDVERAVVCGYSMGGAAVFEFVRTYPERTLGGIPVGGFSEPADARLRLEMTAAVRSARPGGMAALTAVLAAANADMPRTFRRLYQVGRKSHPDDVRTLFEAAIRFNCTDQLASLSAPMRAIYGQKDSHTRRAAAMLAERLPPSSLVQIPAAPHQIPTKHHRELNTLIRDFVRQVQ